MTAQAITRPAELLDHGVQVGHRREEKGDFSGDYYAVGIRGGESLIHMPDGVFLRGDAPVEEIVELLWARNETSRLLNPYDVCQLATEKPELFTPEQRRLINTCVRDAAAILSTLSQQLEAYHIQHD